MVIRYSCNHCDTEIGSIPFEAAKETIRKIETLDEGEKRSFLSVDHDGGLHIRCICEHCEQSLKEFPDYYTLKKWLQ
ncbi:anti-sigma-F factor Fin [Sporosarcina obsidiansis]|uniref:anti-sigma-F factor Fin n=1 Tax=Sporosarcina obsidiansis TaxID=2660748 RepID=UPI001E624D08|nr:anti-sigma-F factor Fin [Sporosarcina obsidiansis]